MFTPFQLKAGRLLPQNKIEMKNDDQQCGRAAYNLWQNNYEQNDFFYHNIKLQFCKKKSHLLQNIIKFFFFFFIQIVPSPEPKLFFL